MLDLEIGAYGRAFGECAQKVVRFDADVLRRPHATRNGYEAHQ